MKLSWGLILGMTVILTPAAIMGKPAIAAEYQGDNIDGRTFSGQVYSFETGGVFDVEVVFKQKRATLYFVNGSRQTILLNNPVITDPADIVGWGKPFAFGVGGGLRIGIADDDLGNTGPPRPRPFEGLWRISLKAEDLQ
jgi:hypothetical protein